MRLSLPAGVLLIVASASAQQSAIQGQAPVTERSESSVPHQFGSVHIDEFSLDADNFIDALLKISTQFRLPLGVEWVKTADALRPVRFSQTHTTLGNLIQAVVSLCAGYEWRTEAGVVHVFQRRLLDDRRNPLNITLKEFGWNHKMTLAQANSFLAQMAGQVVDPLPIGRGIGGSFPSGVEEPKFNLDATNSSVRFILNRMVTVSKVNAWVAAFPSAEVVNPSGFLQPIGKQNYDQPFWAVLRWGDPPPENMVK